MAAIFSAKAGAETLLLEGTRDGGRKILISGGGRCNVLPMHVDESRFVTDSSANTMRKMLRSWPLTEQMGFFEKELGIPLASEPETDKLFPASNKARDIRDGLLAHAARLGVTILTGTRVTNFVPIRDGWHVERERGEAIDADAVVVATGGLSVPATGSDGLGLQVLERLGHTVHPTYAALTPLTANDEAFLALSGVSLTVALSAESARRSSTASGGFLFTHRGYSGPAVLNVSHVLVRARAECDASSTLTVRWTSLGGAEWDVALRPQGGRTVIGALRAQMPERVAAVLLGMASVEGTTRLSELRRDDRLRLIDSLVCTVLPWSGDEGFRKAEVTGGGVSLAEVNVKTLESRRHSGLHVCGEVLDAFGPIGGYNFLWAWATGRAAGIGAAREATTSS